MKCGTQLVLILLGLYLRHGREINNIIIVSCLFSKWPEATALPDKTATGVAEFLFLCFTRHGCCKVKISDQDREFVNQVNDKYNDVVVMLLYFISGER